MFRQRQCQKGLRIVWGVVIEQSPNAVAGVRLLRGAAPQTAQHTPSSEICCCHLPPADPARPISTPSSPETLKSCIMPIVDNNFLSSRDTTTRRERVVEGCGVGVGWDLGTRAPSKMLGAQRRESSMSIRPACPQQLMLMKLRRCIMSVMSIMSIRSSPCLEQGFCLCPACAG